MDLNSYPIIMTNSYMSPSLKCESQFIIKSRLRTSSFVNTYYTVCLCKLSSFNLLPTIPYNIQHVFLFLKFLPLLNLIAGQKEMAFIDVESLNSCGIGVPGSSQEINDNLNANKSK